MKKKTIKTTCHCGKVKVVIRAEVPVESNVTFWCSKECRDDWATGGM